MIPTRRKQTTYSTSLGSLFAIKRRRTYENKYFRNKFYSSRHFRKREMKKKYIFEVQFEYIVEANSYYEAVSLADKQLPDVDGKTTFVVNTMDYGFVPNQETIKKMHEWGDYDDPNVVIVDFETGKVVD